MQTRHTQPIQSNRPATRPSAPNPETPASNGKRVELSLNMPQARAAAVAGTFNNWNIQKTPMRKETGNAWKATLSLAPGRYEYRFVVDGQWLSDPNAKESVPNKFGSTNSVLVV